MAKGDLHAYEETGQRRPSGCDEYAVDWDGAVLRGFLRNGRILRRLPGPELRALVEAALELCPTEPTFDDVRLSYVEIQVQRADLAAFNAAVAAYRKARGGDRGE